VKQRAEYRPQSAAVTMRLIRAGVDPWLAMGQFLDDWRRTDLAERPRLVRNPPRPCESDEWLRYEALLAASVDFLCVEAGLRTPKWALSPSYRLPRPWFLYDGWRLRAWQLAETPVPFRMRNIFGGDRILSRV
jgi:hypothetical protein